jgi:CxxC motif-containing protein
MIRKLTCIDCPKGCLLTIEADGSHVINVTGNQCEKGIAYAQQEIEDPRRILASTILTQGLSVKMLPVKTSAPIPKIKLMEAMAEVKRLRLDRPVAVNEPIVKNFMGLGVDLVSTRPAE